MTLAVLHVFKEIYDIIICNSLKNISFNIGNHTTIQEFIPYSIVQIRLDVVLALSTVAVTTDRVNAIFDNKKTRGKVICFFVSTSFRVSSPIPFKSKNLESYGCSKQNY